MRRLIMICLCVLLAACGTSSNVLPTAPVHNLNPNDNETSPVVAENRVEVPGKLLLVNGGNLVMIADEKTTNLTNSGKKYQPTWSPDGKRIAYIQREESFADLWVMNADGTKKIQVTANEPKDVGARSIGHIASIKWAFYPAWSPDGSLLAYMSQAKAPQPLNEEVYQEYPLSLYLYGTRRIGDGEPAGASFQVLVKADTDMFHPTWSADNTLVVFEQIERNEENGHTLAFFNYETSESGILQGRTTDQFIGAMDPDLSADGAWMAYVRQEGNASDIWAIPAPEADGSVTGTPQQLTSGKRIRMPTWSPDGSKVTYFEVRSNTVYLMMADVQTSGAGKLSLAEPQEIWQGNFDVDSGMSWIR